MSFDNIPQELRQLDRWVCWKIEERDGKPTKVPVNPKTGRNAMPNNPQTWGSFGAALERMQKDGLPGIGFMFNDDGLIGVDIDNCRDPETGELDDIARDIVCALDSYTEISQSGRGLHILCRGRLPEGKRRKGSVEMYETGRFFIMTGWTLDDGHTDIEERTEALARVHARYIADQPRQVKKKVSTSTEVELGDDEIIEKAMNAKNGDLFARLMKGNWKGLYASQSEADLALCNILAFWSGCDHSTIDRIFRRSGLYRGKWDEKRPDGTYGSATIAKAVSDVHESYTPKKQKKTSAQPETPDMDLGYDQYIAQIDKKAPDWLEGPYNDLWNAERLFELRGIDLRYNHSSGKWHMWDGRCWQEDRMGKVRSIAADTMLELGKYTSELIRRCGADSKKIKDFVSWLSKSRNTTKIDNMLKEASHMDGIAVLADDMDQDPWLLNVMNGTINLLTGELQKHRREDNITKICPVEYDPKAKAPTWEHFLERIFDNDKELIAFMQRAVGYSLTGSTKEQVVFVCYGSGANGKSTFIGAIQEMLGEYAKSTNFNTFVVRNDNNSNDIARLVGTRFVSAMEVRERQQLNEALIKQLTGGDKISARFLHKEFFEFTPLFKIWMGANHKPKVTETDNGIWRRLKLIPFVVTIPPEERDGELPAKLRNELPGILSWAVKGCLEWQKNGLRPPKIVEAATNEYRSEMDVLQSFLDECTEENPGAVIKFNDLYIVYCEWCKENGERQMSSNMFGRKLKERGIKDCRTMLFKAREGIQLSTEGKRLWRKRSEGLQEIEPYYGEDNLPLPPDE